MKMFMFVLLLGILACGTDNVVLRYQPMQCQQTPWDAWYAAGGGEFTQKPSTSELILAYYSKEHDLLVDNPQRFDTDAVVCQACDVCPTTHYYTINVEKGAVEKMEDEGWTI